MAVKTTNLLVAKVNSLRGLIDGISSLADEIKVDSSDAVNVLDSLMSEKITTSKREQHSKMLELLRDLERCGPSVPHHDRIVQLLCQIECH